VSKAILTIQLNPHEISKIKKNRKRKLNKLKYDEENDIIYRSEEWVPKMSTIRIKIKIFEQLRSYH
jgi:hypothetical protein